MAPGVFPENLRQIEQESKLIFFTNKFVKKLQPTVAMIYKRRYGWHKDVFILFKRFDDQCLRQWK